ncbi:MAG: enoyl-CoA hydratase/isomerase family protein [Candidatus Schekmanbacteria bacterium]|nr:enoyl-CoA hydratase/isomerase family protein [Candidatus Schekmanbacteria bacterium]
MRYAVDGRGVATVALYRPEVRNAFNERMIAELSEVFSQVSGDPGMRAAVLRGEGRSFCAGADTKWLRQSVTFGEERNLSDARAMAAMYEAIDRCAVPVIGLVHSGAFGGACGLAAVCDVVVAASDAVFGLTEVRLGIIPAVISAPVVRKIGLAAARRYFLTGERFDADTALRLGLVNEVVAESQLGSVAERIVGEILRSGPRAVRACKAHLHLISQLSYGEALEQSAAVIAGLRVTPEAQEGLTAFLEKRRPSWID